VTTVVDAYPSRVGRRAVHHRRLDLVIHHPAGTSSPGPASAEALVELERDGFMVHRVGVLSRRDGRLLDELDALGRDPAVAQRGDDHRTDLRCDPLGVRRAPHERDLRRPRRGPRLVDIAEQILGSQVYIHQSRVNLKPALHRQPFFWHSDFETWHVEDGMPRMRAVSASVALTDNTEFNGPLMLVPGSHRWFVSCVGETPDSHYETSLRRQEIGTPDAGSLELARRPGRDRGAEGQARLGDLLRLQHDARLGGQPRSAPRSNAFFVYNSVENQVGEPFGPSLPARVPRQPRAHRPARLTGPLHRGCRRVALHFARDPVTTPC
jgi:ectoine hydroxylase